MAVPTAPLDGESVTITQCPKQSESTVTVHLSPPTPEPKGCDLLIVSPYSELPHLLDLRTLDTTNRLLAQALVGLKCQRDDYATAPYDKIFNWSEVVQTVKQLASASNFSWKEQIFYIVVFRSQILPTTASSDLGALDKAAHAEATKSGGFLKYDNLAVSWNKSLINAIGIGLDHLTSMVGIWQPAFGEANMMLGLEALEKLIVVLLVLQDPCKHRDPMNM